MLQCISFLPFFLFPRHFHSVVEMLRTDYFVQLCSLELFASLNQGQVWGKPGTGGCWEERECTRAKEKERSGACVLCYECEKASFLSIVTFGHPTPLHHFHSFFSLFFCWSPDPPAFAHLRVFFFLEASAPERATSARERLSKSRLINKRPGGQVHYLGGAVRVSLSPLSVSGPQTLTMAKESNARKEEEKIRDKRERLLRDTTYEV